MKSATISPSRQRLSPGINARTSAAFIAMLLFVSVFSGISDVSAQDKQEMTIEELEKFIEDKRRALEQVEENRKITEEKAQRVREALTRQQEQQAELEAKFEELCQEQEDVKAGSFDACMSAAKSE